jgi:hypothetical protein
MMLTEYGFGNNLLFPDGGKRLHQLDPTNQGESMYKIKFLNLALLIAVSFCLQLTGLSQINRPSAPDQYRLLATNRTSSMEKEMNQAAEAGFRYKGVMGEKRPSGETKL